MMGHTFGMFTNSQKAATFGKMKAQIVDDESNPNHPDNPESPNSPRAEDRFPGYQNPQLGDEGRGRIGRWQQVSLDALETVIEQIIEQYLKDKTWYGKVRCREALWNMYRRLEWWLKQQVDPSRNDYQRAVQMIKDCINHILEEAQDPELAHNVSLPLCPAPYFHPFHGDYFNHYDGMDVEVPLFRSQDLPLTNDFPGHFRYVSSSEDQEWQIVHSVGGDETTGSELIMKLPLNRLLFGNSSKITFNWRFKKHGFIRFKYMASAAAGNGLSFFINNNQVGGEWNSSAGWQEVRFNVSPGQTYKFDWLIRRQTERVFGSEAVYIKDVECVEVIRSLESPTPPDYDTLGSAAYEIGEYEWITYSQSSVIKTHFDGIADDSNRKRTLSMGMENECDGEVSFGYRMRTVQPQMDREYYLMYVDDLFSRTQTANGHHGSSASKTSVDAVWTGDGNSFTTKGDAAKITYDLTVGPEATLDTYGTLEIICPPMEIDHYEPSVIQTTGTGSWWMSGGWQRGIDYFVLQDPTQGDHDLTTSVDLPEDGWFTFSFSQDLRDSESFEVLVGGQSMLRVSGQTSNTYTIPLTAGSHQIIFRLHDWFTEQPQTDYIKKQYLYGRGSGNTPVTTQTSLGSKATITRNWDVADGRATTFTDGKTIDHVVTLNPGASFRLDELVTFMSNPTKPATQYSQILYDSFNDQNATPRLGFSPSWEWQDILRRMNTGSGDGVYKVEGVVGTHTASAYVNAPDGGYVTFEYGGLYGGYDYMELLAGGTQIWRGNTNSNNTNTDVKVPLPAGNYELTWVYHCRGGTVITIPSGTDQPTNPDNEVCYTGGYDSTPVDYNIASANITTPRSAIIGWSGTSMYTSPTAHAAEANGATIVRNMKAPSFGNLGFHEKLHIEAGDAPLQDGLYTISPNMSAFGQLPGRPMFSNETYFSLDVGVVNPPNGVGWMSNQFYTDGRIELSYDYLSYLVDTTGPVFGRNMAGRDAKYRAQVNVYLISSTSGDVTGGVNRIHQILENVGQKQHHTAITNWSGAGHFKLTKNVAAGYYYLLITIKDDVSDADRDAEGYWYYAAFKGLNIRVSDKRRQALYDETKVKVDLIDRSTGAVVATDVYSTEGAASKDVSVGYYGLEPNKPYQVRYTLLKGKGTTGGMYGRGGAFKVTDGLFDETWTEYCTSNGKYYPKSQSTQRPPATDTTTTAPLTTGAWAWLDAIDVRASMSSICNDTAVRLTVEDSGVLISSQEWNQFSPSKQMSASVTNNSTAIKTYLVRETFHSTCGDGAMLTDGQIEINDILQPAPSHITVNGYSVTSNKPIWMGGCDGSTITVTLTDDGGAVVYTQTFSGAGLHSFSVSNIDHSPYSKYRLQIETDQKGTVSQISGKQYMTTFKLIDFRVYEDWENVPDPFNGKLEFFIDGQLMGTYTNTSDSFSTVSFPLAKGLHNLKWVFTELGSGNVYDQCEIDFLKITNWICDKVKVVPYCAPGGGDICVEELIKCLLNMWNNRPKACMIGKKIWLFT